MPEKVQFSKLPTPGEFTEQVVPTEAVPLPSDGVVYPPDSPLHGRRAVEIRSMTARDEDILTSRALLKSGKAISMLLRSCITDRGVDVDKMLEGDRNAALIGIRITGYGPDYNVTITCPNCGERTQRTIDLGQLPIKRMPEDVKPISQGLNEFAFKLPVSQRNVHFRMMTGEDSRELLQIIERTRKAGLNEELVTTRLKIQIVSIDGESDRGKLARMIETMPARDSRELRLHIDKISPGVELKTEFSCPSCDAETQEVEVPLGTEFFWPHA